MIYNRTDSFGLNKKPFIRSVEGRYHGILNCKINSAALTRMALNIWGTPPHNVHVTWATLYKRSPFYETPFLISPSMEILRANYNRCSAHTYIYIYVRRERGGGQFAFWQAIAMADGWWLMASCWWPSCFKPLQSYDSSGYKQRVGNRF